ncbi:MAG: hypothetical protein Q7U54_21615 [Bacteroidales bacterium]|nr:hypothetical protein [Bacteroidales bacterium]
MDSRNFYMSVLFCVLQTSIFAQTRDSEVYKSDAYTIYNNRVEQAGFRAIALSATEMTSNYRSPDADKYSPTISFKFSINLQDNEMISGHDHLVTLLPENGACTTTVTFGKQYVHTNAIPEGINLAPNTRWTVRLDMRDIFQAFKDKGFYTLYNGEKLYQPDFKGVYIAGGAAPLMWDFNNLKNNPDLKLQDTDGDDIYETTLVLNKQSDEKHTDAEWKLSRDISALPQYKSDFLLSDAVYNMSLEEMLKAIETDSTFRTGKEWSGVWTRDVSYSIILSMAYMQPKVAMNSLMRKVSKSKKIIQDTGTGGAWPASTDRMIWAVAAWEVYKATGDNDWLQQAYQIIKNSIEDDLVTLYDPVTGMVKGESSFLDWREQTYPKWMQPADIFESECLGTNAVHFQANIILSKMAIALNQKQVAEKHKLVAEKIKTGINTYLWLPEKGYYAQFLYGRNFKIVSPKSEALGEALCVLFGIADDTRAKQIVGSTPVTSYGIPCIYPEIPNIPPYHNNAVWPFVQTYWLWAAAGVSNEKSVVESISAIYRPAALFLTNKENFVAETGDFNGTQINSSIMLWSLSGNISIIHRILFGIRFEEGRLSFNPFVPFSMQGKRTLTNFKYRNAFLDIELNGYGSRIVSFQLDGKETSSFEIPETISGKHTVRIELDNQLAVASTTNQKPVVFTLPAPVVKYENHKITWQPLTKASGYKIIANGKLLKSTTKTSFQVKSGTYIEYQVVAFDKNNLESFASEPLPVVNVRYIQIIQAENVSEKSNQSFKGYSGDGFIEISKTVNKTVHFKIKVDTDGLYSIDFRYANGNGPTNTENKCAIRTLSVDNNPVNAIVFPQRGKEEWSNWGFSNSLKVFLTKGEHVISISLEDANENMNGEINQAMIDFVRVQFIQ